jgi:hypothetical protein
VFHYWHRVKKAIVDDYLAKKITQSWMALPTGDKLNDVRDWTKMLRDSFDGHVLTLRDRAIQEFCMDHFGEGFKYALKAIAKDPRDKIFLRDALYHTLRGLKIK